MMTKICQYSTAIGKILPTPKMPPLKISALSIPLTTLGGHQWRAIAILAATWRSRPKISAVRCHLKGRPWLLVCSQQTCSFCPQSIRITWYVSLAGIDGSCLFWALGGAKNRNIANEFSLCRLHVCPVPLILNSYSRLLISQ